MLIPSRSFNFCRPGGEMIADPRLRGNDFGLWWHVTLVLRALHPSKRGPPSSTARRVSSRKRGLTHKITIHGCREIAMSCEI